MDDEISKNFDDFPPLPSSLQPSLNTPKEDASDNENDDLPLIPPPLPFHFLTKEPSNNDAFDEDDEDFPLPPPEELLSPKSAPAQLISKNIFGKKTSGNIENDDKKFDGKINDPGIEYPNISVPPVLDKVSTPSDSNPNFTNHSISKNEGDLITTEFLSYANVLSGSIKPSSLKKMAFNSPVPFKINKNASFSSNRTISKPTFNNKTTCLIDNSNSAGFDDVANAPGSVTKDVLSNEPTVNDNSNVKTDFESVKFSDGNDSGIFSASEVVKTPQKETNNDENIINDEVFVKNNNDFPDKASSKIDANSNITNRTYNSTLKKLANNQLNEVLKDYYKDDEPSKEDTEKMSETESEDSKKPQKPIIAQALLPKNQRHASDSGQNNADINILAKKQSFNVTLDELKSFLNPETGVKCKLKNADDFYLGKRTTVVDQTEGDSGFNSVDNNESTLVAIVTKINDLQNPQECMDSKTSIKKDLSVSSPTKGILSPKPYFPFTTSNKTLHEVRNNENTDAKKETSNKEIGEDLEKKHSAKNIESKPIKLTKSTSLRPASGIRPKVPNVKGFTDEQIRRLVESQKLQNPGSSTKEENSNVVDVQTNNNLTEIHNMKTPEIGNTNDFLKKFDNSLVKFEKLNLNLTSENNFTKEGIKNSDETSAKVELDLQSKKLFFEQVSMPDQKKGHGMLIRSKSSVNETSNHHRKSVKKIGDGAECELKAVFEKKFTQAKEKQNEINEPNLTNIINEREPNKSDSNDTFEGHEPIVITPVSATKAYFESKVSASKPLNPVKNKNAFLKKSASMLEKPSFHKKDLNFFKDKPNLNEENAENNEIELVENDEGDIINKCEQETVETLVNKYTSLRPENVSESKIKLGALGKSSSVDQKIVMPIEPENRKLPGKSLASLTAGTKTSGSNTTLGTKTWSATLKTYAHKSNQ